MYETECLTCRENSASRGFIYVGESARSSRERLEEHIDDYKGKKESSHITLQSEQWRNGGPRRPRGAGGPRPLGGPPIAPSGGGVETPWP